MKKGVLLGVLVLLVGAATVFLTTHWAVVRAKQAERKDGVPEADRHDEKLWKKTPEFKTVTDELVRIAYAAEARGTPTPDEIELLIKYMHSPHYGVRMLAVTVATEGRFDPARSILIPHVLGLLSDPVSAVRVCAAGTLGRIGDKSLIPFLYPLLKDARPPVAETAQRAILKLQGEETAPEK